MQIYINDETVDFSLEAERTLADVVRSLEQWLAGQRLVIVSLEINRQPFRQHDLDERGATPLAEIREIRLTTSDFFTLEKDGLERLSAYCDGLGKAIAAADGAALAGLLERYPEAESSLRFLCAGRETEEQRSRRSELDRLLAGTTAGMIALWDAPTRERAVALCGELLAELHSRQALFQGLEQSSRTLARDTIHKLRAAAGRLREVSILLQTGKDAQAMQTIASFTELAQVFLHLLTDMLSAPTTSGLRVNGRGLEEYSQDLNKDLRELVEAFEKKDYILIGDLCEYEISPKVLSLIDTVEQSLSA